MHLYGLTIPSPLLLSTPFALIVLAGLGVRAEEVQDEIKITVTNSVECSRKSHSLDTIQVHYTGRLENGEVFDSSINRGVPFSFTIGRGMVIQGWDVGLLDMCIGESRRLTIPAVYGYGSRAMGSIPAGSTLIFDTTLVGITGVKAAEPQSTVFASSQSISTLAIVSGTTSYSSSVTQPLPTVAPLNSSTTTTIALATPMPKLDPVDALKEPKDGPHSSRPGAEDGECRLLGPFALFVQAGLGFLALLSLVFKRWRERPRRPLKIWFFDVSKQVFGSVLLHIMNLLLSMLSSGDFEAANHAKQVAAQLEASTGRGPNPCSFYLINLAIDTTIGIPILVVLLRLLHHGAALTPLARPTESIRSGHYGQPPHVSWWLKQSIIYFCGLLLMKLCVFFIFEILPWIAWVGDWMLRWTEGSVRTEILFTMFVFPLIMNAAQYYIIDGFIKDPAGGEEYAAVANDDDDDDDEADRGAGADARRGAGYDDAIDDDASSSTAVEHEQGKKTTAGVVKTKEVDTPEPQNLSRREAGSE